MRKLSIEAAVAVANLLAIGARMMAISGKLAHINLRGESLERRLDRVESDVADLRELAASPCATT